MAIQITYNFKQEQIKGLSKKGVDISDNKALRNYLDSLVDKDLGGSN